MRLAKGLYSPEGAWPRLEPGLAPPDPVKTGRGTALARAVQLVGASSLTTKGFGFSSQSGTHPGCGFRPQLGCVPKATGGYVSLTLMFFLSLRLSKISKQIL